MASASGDRFAPASAGGDTRATVTESATVPLVGEAPEGMPEPTLSPPQLARSGDPFSALRVVHFVSRLRRNETHQLRDVVTALNAAFLDWYFSEKVVLAELVQLQANWGISFHGDDRIVLDRNERGHTLLVIDSTKMSSFLVNEARRLADACSDELREFTLGDGVSRDN
jgi:hypothetical protein